MLLGLVLDLARLLGGGSPTPPYAGGVLDFSVADNSALMAVVF